MAVKLVRGIRQREIPGKVLLLVTTYDWRHLLDCIELGVHGCVLGDSSLSHLVDAIERSVMGDMFCSPQILELLFAGLSRRAKQSAKSPSRKPARRNRNSVE